MKIVFFRHSILNRGGDKMVLAHAEYMAECGHSVSIYLSEMDTTFTINSAINIIRLRSFGRIGSILSALFCKINSDIIVADIIPMAFLLALRNPNKVLFFAQGYDEGYYSNSIYKFVIRILYYLGLSLMRIPVIAVSDGIRSMLVGKYDAVVTLIPNGIDFTKFYYEKSEDLIKLKENRKALLVFARYDSAKGFDLVPEIINQVVQMSPVTFELWVIGEQLKEPINSVPCRLFGYVSESKMRRLMSSADIFLCPSRSEGFSLMVYEAFATRCPVVTTSAVSIAVDGVNALVGDIESIHSISAKVCELLEDERIAKRIVNTAYECVKKYSLQSSMQTFCDVINMMKPTPNYK